MKHFTVSLFLTTFFIFIFSVENAIVNTMKELYNKIEITIFLDKSVKSPEVVFEKIRNLDEVKTAKFISKDEIYLMAKADSVISKYSRVIELNPFPHTITLKPIDVKLIPIITEKIQALKDIEEIVKDEKAIKIYEVLLKYLKLLYTIACVIVFFMFLNLVVFVYELLIRKIILTWEKFILSTIGVICSVFLFLVIKGFFKDLLLLFPTNFILSSFFGLLCGVSITNRY